MGRAKAAAIIGFGGMGQRHLKAYQKIGIDIVAICDWYPDKVQSLLPEFPGDRIYGDYKEMLRKECVDIVSVVTNGPTHSDVAIQASNAGIPNILCEKPIATRLSDARQVIDTCNDNNTRLAVNHIRRWSQNYARLKAAIDEGLIGELRHLYFSCGSTGLGNFAIHFFDTARYLTGSEPEWALGFLDRTGTPNPRGAQFSDPGGYGIIQMKNGTRFFIDGSEDTGVQYSFQLVGTYGRIIIDELNNQWYIRTRQEALRDIPLTRYGTDMEHVPFESEGPFDIVELTGRALAELSAGQPISSQGIDGLKSLEMVIALHASDKAGNQKVSFPLSGEDARINVEIG